jgi:beta-glucosidase
LLATGYNKINGEYAGGNAVLLKDVLKGAWSYLGWVMSDWGATRSWEFVLRGLDQESGLQIDKINWHAQPFVEAVRQATSRASCVRSASPIRCAASCVRCLQ